MSNGMKQTEIGEIPEDWEVVQLREIISDLKSGVSVNSTDKRITSTDEIGILKTSAVANGKFKPHEHKVIIEKDIQRAKLNPIKGSILISRMNTPALVGDSCYVEESYNTLFIPDRLWMTVFNAKNLINSQWLSFVFRSDSFKENIKDIATGTSNSMKNISKESFLSLQISLPPLAEQQKIAEILSTVDEKIAVIDEQLAKTHELKTGLMQRLLTKGIGHTTFKDSPLGEIPESWKVIPLETVSEFITKGSTPTTYGFNWVEKGVVFLRSECVGVNGFTMSGAMFISNEAHKALGRSEVKAGDLLMTITGNVGRVCILPPEVKEANINQHIARIRINSPLAEASFVYQYFSQESIIKSYSKIVTGQAYPQLSLKQVREMVIPLPSLAEQDQIAKLLITVDEKIQVLRDKREHYQTLKRGLMQQLLTGKLRVRVTEDAVPA